MMAAAAETAVRQAFIGSVVVSCDRPLDLNALVQVSDTRRRTPKTLHASRELIRDPGRHDRALISPVLSASIIEALPNGNKSSTEDLATKMRSFL